MARFESVAIGGYYPTPPELVELIASRVSLAAVIQAARRNTSGPFKTQRFPILDPCAGDGAALIAAGQVISGGLKTLPVIGAGCHTSIHVPLCAVEMEQTRAKELRTNLDASCVWGQRECVESDAFSVSYAMGGYQGAAVLWLNPPYDSDPLAGRLEHAFLQRHASLLMPDGVLIFIVPQQALRASAQLLASEFYDIEIRSFPDPHHAIYKQVVLYARRRSITLNAPLQSSLDLITQAVQVRPPILDSSSPVYELSGESSGGFSEIRSVHLDITQVERQITAWGGGTDGTGYQLEMKDLVNRPYPLAMIPRPAHIALALGAGIFNGSKITPSGPHADRLPPLLVKAVFAKEYKTVDEKTDRDGNIKSLIQVQQPKLNVTVLDLSTYRYHDLAQGTTPTEEIEIAKFNMADLLVHYGPSLMEVMSQQCPALHDPGRPGESVELPTFARPLYHAQAQAAQCALKLLFRGENVAGLGEIGSGKTSLALAVASALSPPHHASTMRRLAAADGVMRSNLGDLHRVFSTPRSALKPVRTVLVMCPPHLLDSWTDQAAAVLPGAMTVRISSCGEVDWLARYKSAPPARKAAARGLSSLFDEPGQKPGDGLMIAIVSRESAKLGHGYADGRHAGLCPRCGAVKRDISIEEVIGKRLRCGAIQVTPGDLLAREIRELAEHLIAEVDPFDARLVPAVPHRLRYRKTTQGAWGANAMHVLRPLIPTLIERAAEHVYVSGTQFISAVCGLLLSIPASKVRDQFVADMALRVYQVGSGQGMRDAYGVGIGIRNQARDLLITIRDKAILQTAYCAMLAIYDGTKSNASVDEWQSFRVSGTRMVGQVKHALDAMPALIKLARWNREPPCTEPLYAATATSITTGNFSYAKTCTTKTRVIGGCSGVRRYPIADYIVRRHPQLFDLLIADEWHEYATDGSAQERSMHRLTALGMPVIALTGSLMNGYAKALFRNLWSLSSRFRAEYKHDDIGRFTLRYGYYKRAVDVGKAGRAQELTYGAVSDRVERGLDSERKLGDAPGFLPHGLIQFILPIAVTMQKADMALDLPTCSEIPVTVEPDDQVKNHGDRLWHALHQQIRTDRFREGLSGKLWGQMIQLASYPDRSSADTGNVGEERKARRFQIAYPADMKNAEGEPLLESGRVICDVPGISSEELGAKEKWMVALVNEQIARGRNCLIYVWHTSRDSGMLERIARIITRHCRTVPEILEAQKVQAKKRQAWIDANVIRPQRQVLIVNPVAVMTGLNNLVHFSTAIFLENPACNPIVVRQAKGRLDRIGQRLPVEIYYPIYAGAQEQAHTLLLSKIAVSEQTDGLDASEALAAAGADSGDDSALASYDIGRALYRLMAKED